MALFPPRVSALQSFFPRRGTAVALMSVLFMSPVALHVAAAQAAPQTTTPATDQQGAAPAEGTQATPAPAPAAPGDLPAGTTSATPQDNVPTGVLSNRTTRKKTRKSVDEPQPSAKQQKKDEKVTASKDTVKEQREMKRRLRDNPLANVDSKQPDKQLFDRAQVALKKGKFDVARLLLQDMLATYPDSEYQMRAKLAFADSWYREGGTAALTQAETEYHDFIIFFPNVPEAAEAQMRIGDIYFKQMDKPDRDYTKAIHAQEEYRTMMTQYPDSTLIPDAKQKLREVQELLATRETGIADFYEGHENYAAAIARYQTVVDTYPLYSKIDSALIGLGDAYAAQAHYVRVNPAMKNLNEDQKSRLLRVYEDAAAAAYGRVVTVYSASPRVEDARDRLEALGRPVPEPTAEQVAASQALENSRQAYSVGSRVRTLVMRTPDVVQAAKVGDPSMADPKATLAPNVVKHINEEFQAAIKGTAAPAPTAPVAPSTDAAADPSSPVGVVAPAAPGTTALSDIPAADAPATAPASTGVTPSAFTNTPDGVAPVTGSGADRAVGVTIITPGRTAVKDAGNGLNSVGPANNTALPEIEKAATAPDAVNDVQGVKTPNGQAPPVADANGKVHNPKPDFDKGEESSSKHKKKKGLKKLDPL